MSDHPTFQAGTLFEKRLLCFETAIQDAFGEFRRVIGELDGAFHQEIAERVKEYGQKEIQGWRNAYGDMEQQEQRRTKQLIAAKSRIQVLKGQLRQMKKAKQRSR